MKDALPIDAVLPQILDELRRGPALVLEAPPGAGKTTRVPPALLDLVQGEILVLEPRRLAARTAARRVAQELGERVGETVGFQVRFEDVSSNKTRIRFLTEGILARKLLSEPRLPGVGAVLLDEFHERHLPADLCLALLHGRRDLKLIVMSATLDAAPLAQHLHAPVVRSEGRRFPVEIDYLEKPDERRLGDQVAAAVRKLTVPGTTGDLLVFLPGAAEIRHAMTACAELSQHRDLLLVALHGDLGSDEQDRALQPAAKRKVIFSTNVAETSVTVPGVTAVIDSGLARIASHSPWSGLSRLEVAKISRASAEQRAGRAGRLGPGRALRLYTKHDFDARPDHHPPEIERLDLAATVLELRAAGHDPAALPWLDEPPPGSLQTAHELLQRLGALDAKLAVTELGRQCARLPLHPRLARLAVEAARRGFPAEGAAAAALLSERDLRRETQAPSGSSDVIELLDVLDEAKRRGFPRGGAVDAGAARRADQARAQLQRLLPQGQRAQPREQALLISVLAGFPDRVGKRRGADVVLSGGGAAQLSADSAVRDAPLLVAVEAEERRNQGRARATVRLASAIEPEWLLDLHAEALHEEAEVLWEPARSRVEVESRLLYDQLVLEESRRAPGPAEAAAAAALLVAHASFDRERIGAVRERLRLAAQHSSLVALSDDDVQRALAKACEGRTALEELKDLDLTAALVPDPAARALLEKLTPESVALPSGRKLQVEYVENQPPAVRSRLQDFFGLARGPAICNGKLPLTLHLLAPSGRAQQVTQDLAGFWQRHYPAIRKELMRKYPRHPWPEDGATATPPPPSVNRRPHR